MSQSNTLFLFGNNTKHFSYSVNGSILLHIKQLNHAVSYLYFTDEMNNNINIPTGMFVYTYDYQNVQHKIILEPHDNQFVLCYTDNYDIEFNGEKVLKLESQRTWKVSHA